MRRRELIAGAGGLAVLATGVASVFTDFQLADLTGGERETSPEDDIIQPHDLPRIEADGSPPGVETVPAEGSVTFLTLFATWCTICQRKMDPLGEAYASLDDDVQFVSVTNEPVGQTVEPAEVADWWANYEGNWPVAHDDDLDLTMAVDAPGVPYSVVLDADNRITWSDGGYKSADEIVSRIDDAR